jgi:hypothetical protein
MASLALMVAIIFLTVLLSGVFALIASYFSFTFIAIFFAIISILSGAYWCVFSPFPVSLIGILSIVLGIIAIKNL